jgi:hypothetical protein
MTYRSQPLGVRRNHTSAGPTTRKLITKSVVGESLSKGPVRMPVCSREVQAMGGRQCGWRDAPNGSLWCAT